MKWKQEQATEEEYRRIDQVCGDSARKAKAQIIAKTGNGH